MRQIFDYLILSLLLAFMFCTYHYIFTTASMILLYATVYALIEEEKSSS